MLRHAQFLSCQVLKAGAFAYLGACLVMLGWDQLVIAYAYVKVRREP